MKTLLLIDGSHFLFRAFYAMPRFTTKDGRPTGAIRGILSMIRSLRKTIPTPYIACVFDPKGKTFRSDIYPEYKANRPPMDEELAQQILPAFEAIRLEGIPLLQVPGIEADDTIGTLATMAEKEGFKVVIATGDKDYAQLVDDNIHLINTQVKNEQLIDKQGVLEKFGVLPEQIIGFLALMGDKVDNVPGIQKCGEKKAAKWLNQYGSIQNIIENSNSFKGKDGEYLREGLKFLPTAIDLVTIRRDADLSGYVNSLEQLKEQPIDRKALYRMYKDLEFRTWAAEIAPKPQEGEYSADLFSQPQEPQNTVVKPAVVDFSRMPDYSEFAQSDKGGKFSVQLLKENEKVQELAARLSQTKEPVGVSVFASDDSQFNSKLLGLAVAFLSGESFFVTISMDLFGLEGVDMQAFKSSFEAWLKSDSPKILSESKLSKHVLANEGLELNGIIHDVNIQSYVLEAHRSHSLESIARHWLNIELPQLQDLEGKGRNKIARENIPVEKVAEFSCQRAWIIGRLGMLMQGALDGHPNLKNLYETIELPLMPVLFKMERSGVKLNCSLLEELTAVFQEELTKIEEQAYLVAGEKFNLSSPKALGEILFEKLAVKPFGKMPKKTATGNYSTNEEVLSELAPFIPLAALALQYRSISKLINTYTDKLPRIVNPKDGRIHTTFEQTIAVTGRLSSTNPNLQNIPARSGEGRKIREAFVAEEGCKIISADYSQIELRIMAHLSGDKGLVDAFNRGLDIHKATAAEVYGITPEEVTADQRRIAKVVNFGLIYGMSAFGLAKNLGISRTEAKDYIDKYFHHFPGVRLFMEKIRDQAGKDGFVKTVFGRELWLPDLHGTGPRRAGAERAAINAPMQGTAADLIKKGMIAVQSWLESSRMQSRLLLQIHDELVLEVPEDEVDVVKVKLPELMDTVAQLHVPLIAEVGVGDNWEAAH